MTRSRSVLLLAVVLAAVAAAPAAATTRFAAPTGAVSPACNDRAAPCPLTDALAAATTEDTISLAAGQYETPGIRAPDRSLRWVATDPASRPVLISRGPEATVELSDDATRTSFEGLEIVGTGPRGAIAVADSNDVVTVRSSVVRGTSCIDALNSATVIVEDSALFSPAGSACLRLGPRGTVRRSTVARTQGLAGVNPPASISTQGVVEDTRIEGGLELFDGVAHRVDASGRTAIFGSGLVTDSVARAIGRGGAAAAATTRGGGTLRLVGVTAVATAAPALRANTVALPTGPVSADRLVVTNSIARGAPDLQTPATVSCALRASCALGRIEVDHTNFAVREPAAGAPGAGVIAEGAGNQAGDPRFTDFAGGDLRLLAGSPAIDAGVAQSAGQATDLDGKPRVHGPAPDLGAFEFAPPPPPPPPPGTGAGGAPEGTPGGPSAPPGGTADPRDRRAPRVAALVLSRTRFTTATRGALRRGSTPSGTTLRVTVDEAARVDVVVEQGLAGHLRGGRCVTTGGTSAQGRACLRWAVRGAPIVRRRTSPGTLAVAFSGRVGSRALEAGRYRFAVTATDAAGNRSAVRTASFVVVQPS